MIRDYNIGIFDSGIGGLTVMKAVTDLMPNENIIYFGDTARMPYGNKSAETIISYAIENASFLLDQQVKCIVVACNTASAFALEALEKKIDVPIIGVIDPLINDIDCGENIAILGTKGTINSRAYQNKLKQKIPNSKLYPVACPLFVPLIEESFIDHQITKLVVDEYLSHLREKSIDTVLLACTHYPIIEDLIDEYFDHKVQIINSAKACAKEVLSTLTMLNLNRINNDPPKHQFYTSDNMNCFEELKSKLYDKILV